MVGRWLRWVPVAATLLALAPVHAPALLLFPYKAQARGFTVRAEYPLPPARLDAVLADAERRLATGALTTRPLQWDLYLTEGGWRWRWLALNAADNFAVTRWLTDVTILNRSSLATARVYAPRRIGPSRGLGSDIAHEVTHGMIYNHFGLIRALATPKWVIEGYCDHVAGESTLDAHTVARLEADGVEHPVIDNFYAGRKVDRILSDNGNSVDKLFATAR